MKRRHEHDRCPAPAYHATTEDRCECCGGCWSCCNCDVHGCFSEDPPRGGAILDPDSMEDDDQPYFWNRES